MEGFWHSEGPSTGRRFPLRSPALDAPLLSQRRGNLKEGVGGHTQAPQPQDSGKLPAEGGRLPNVPVTFARLFCHFRRNSLTYKPKARSRSYVTSLSFAAVLFSFASAEPPPRLIDAPIADYYYRALEAADGGETQKALAMLRVLLIPNETGIFADFTALPQEAKPLFERGVQRGFQLWTQALGPDFPFVLTPSRDAPVVMRFTDGLSSGCKGEIRSKRRIQWNHQVHYCEFTAEVEIAKYASGRSLMTEWEVAHVVAHELGHALGLADSDSTERAMGPLLMGNPYARLHESEVASVKEFRRVVRAAISRLTAANIEQSPSLTFALQTSK